MCEAWKPFAMFGEFCNSWSTQLIFLFCEHVFNNMFAKEELLYVLHYLSMNFNIDILRRMSLTERSLGETYATSRSEESSASLKLWMEVERGRTGEGISSVLILVILPEFPPLCSSCNLRSLSCSSRFCFLHLARRFLNHTWKKDRERAKL